MESSTCVAGVKRIAKSAWPDWQQGPVNSLEMVEYSTAPSNRNTQKQGKPQQEQRHIATTFNTKKVSSPKRPYVGSPTVTDLTAQKLPDIAIRKHRASTLIQKYSGARWREAQRTKWLLDIVLHIDQDYMEYIMDQAVQIENLHKQLQHTVHIQTSASAGLVAQNERLSKRVESLEHQLRLSQAALLDMQNRMAASNLALFEAESATRAAAAECHQLQQDVAMLAEYDATARKALSNRTHAMREALASARGRLRQTSEHSKRQHLEVADLISQYKAHADAEREILTAQLASSMAAANTLAGAAGRLRIEGLELELEAYKEPWTYMCADKSPTRRRELSKVLGLKQKSFNVKVPY